MVQKWSKSGGNRGVLDQIGAADFRPRSDFRVNVCSFHSKPVKFLHVPDPCHFPIRCTRFGPLPIKKRCILSGFGAPSWRQLGRRWHNQSNHRTHWPNVRLITIVRNSMGSLTYSRRPESFLVQALFSCRPPALSRNGKRNTKKERHNKIGREERFE